jgi:large subunit ribosomal protein L24
MRILKYKKADRAKAKGQKRHAQNSERVKLHVTTGDTVKVVRGDDKGHVGKIIRVYRKTGRVVVEGANIVKRHRKARSAEEQGGIVDFPAPIHASNVMLLDPSESTPVATRTRRRIDEDGTKERISVKSGEAIPRVR